MDQRRQSDKQLLSIDTKSDGARAEWQIGDLGIEMLRAGILIEGSHHMKYYWV